MILIDPRYLPAKERCDFTFLRNGSITMIYPEHDAVDGVLADLCPDGMFEGNTLLCEDRYGPDLAANLCRNGYRVMLPGGRIVTEHDLS